MRHRAPAILVSALCGAALLTAAWSGLAAATVPPTVPNEQGTPLDSVPPSTTEAPVVDPATGLPAARGPLVVQPPGCITPDPPLAVFEGRVADAVSTAARFDVLRVLTGSLAGYQIGGQVDVHYGDETRFLDEGATYLVGVRRDVNTSRLVSTVREPAPLFGGDAVVGLDDSAIGCIALDDPVRTLSADGTAVDTGVLTPLRGKGSSILRAVLVPLAVAFGVLLALVAVKQMVFAVGRALREVSDTEPLPRERRHATPGSGGRQTRP